MSAESATLAGRRRAESLMVDTGRGIRPDNTGESAFVYDETLQEEVEQGADLFSSRCKVQARALQPREVEVGSRTAASVRTELHLPADSPPLRVGDLWVIETAHPLSLSRPGQRLRVVGPVAGTFKTAARYQVEEVVS